MNPYRRIASVTLIIGRTILVLLLLSVYVTLGVVGVDQYGQWWGALIAPALTVLIGGLTIAAVLSIEKAQRAWADRESSWDQKQREKRNPIV